MNWKTFGYYLSFVAVVCMLVFTIWFGRFLSQPIPGVFFFFGIGGALLIWTRSRLLRILGELLVVGCSVLWWFTAIGGYFLPTPMFFSNVQQPLGWIMGFPVLLATLGGALTIISSIRQSR
ncbi:MAG: hypothetical protein JSV05_05025 [Candidatus Bathyarchaeota archaeon]|nr:MAG: hypothetical protein JSV05_05025 [Candidatus Bathyarchaeota archaeon]